MSEEHRSRWSFPAPGLSRVSRIPATRPQALTARVKGKYHCHLSLSFCPFGEPHFFFPPGGGGVGRAPEPRGEQPCTPWPTALHPLLAWMSGQSEVLRGQPAVVLNSKMCLRDSLLQCGPDSAKPRESTNSGLEHWSLTQLTSASPEKCGELLKTLVAEEIQSKVYDIPGSPSVSICSMFGPA